jgi:hypothetical protein
MNNKTIGIIVCVVGVIILLVSLLADAIGIGGSAGIGTYQIIGAVLGAVIAVVGAYLIFRK